MPFHATLSKRLEQGFPIRLDEGDARKLATYNLFLKFFKENVVVTNPMASDLQLGVVLVYTWMQPSELDADSWKHFPMAKKMLLRDKSARLNADEVAVLKTFVGDSLAATSKFLHFVNPNRYAIWDWNVARAAYRYGWRQCNRSDRYLQYLDDISGLTLDDELRHRVCDVIGDASELRVKEFALSQLGAAEAAARSRASDLDMADFPFASAKFTLQLGTEEDGA